MASWVYVHYTCALHWGATATYPLAPNVRTQESGFVGDTDRQAATVTHLPGKK